MFFLLMPIYLAIEFVIMRTMEGEIKPQFSAYLDKIRERAKKSRVHSRHQMIGLMIADILGDPSHKSLYIKMARDENSEKMLYIAKTIAENVRIKNKGAYFMKMWHLSDSSSTKPYLKTNKISMEVVTIKNTNSKILKHRVTDFDFSKYSREQIKDIIDTMRKIMKAHDGVGLSANQIGLNWRMFVAEYNNKFYAVFNPKIIKYSQKICVLEEGCLSIPDAMLAVPRFESITLESQDKNGKAKQFKVRGILARIFQHEIDHLNGKLITDYSTER